jgi:hypothetical protein
MLSPTLSLVINDYVTLASSFSESFFEVRPANVIHMMIGLSVPKLNFTRHC